MNDQKLSKQNITDTGLGPRRYCNGCGQMRGTQHGRIKLHYKSPGVICPGSNTKVTHAQS